MDFNGWTAEPDDARHSVKNKTQRAVDDFAQVEGWDCHGEAGSLVVRWAATNDLGKALAKLHAVTAIEPGDFKAGHPQALQDRGNTRGQILGYHGQPVRVCPSKGSQVPYVERWEDNVLPPPNGQPWPEALHKQVTGYVARRSWFSEDDADFLSAHVGPISKFQSLNSEDAVTWSWFGTLGMAAPDQRQATVQWLFERIGVDAVASAEAKIDQWSRVFTQTRRKAREDQNSTLA